MDDNYGAMVERRGGGGPNYSEKTLSQCHFVLPQILHELTRDRSRDTAVRGRRVPAMFVTRPLKTKIIIMIFKVALVPRSRHTPYRL
jgi:hypothetical protein